MIRIGSVEEQHRPVGGGARWEGDALRVIAPRAAMDDWLRR